MRLLIFFLVLASGGGAAAQSTPIDAQDYELYCNWRDGREDPRLAGLDDAAKLQQIAKSLKVPPRRLEQAVARLDPLAPGLGKDIEQAIGKALQDTLLKGRVLEVHVDARSAHVVAGVKWRCGDARDADKEAAYAAWAVSSGGPLVKTLAVWCVNVQDTNLFSAKIGRDNLQRIDRAGIERFAATRYIRLFEEVKRGPHRL